MGSIEQVLEGLWRFTAIHPDWEDESDGWEPEVAGWGVAGPDGLLLIDPLIEDWGVLDGIVEGSGGCAGVIRTCFWHQRSIEQVRERYGAEVWASPPVPGVPPRPFDHAATPEERLPGDLRAFDVVRDDELGLWLPNHRALLFGDVMIRSPAGELTMCPESWVAREGGHPRLREALIPLLDLDPEHVLVCHGPLVLGDARAALEAALSTPESTQRRG
jgi:hypothetical protein